MECEHLNWAETANGRYRFCADCGRDLGAVGDEDPSTLSAGGVSPTAPDEREALIERFNWLRDSGVCSPTTRGLLDDAERLLRRSREATTEPRPITDTDVEVAARAIFAVDLGDNWRWDLIDDPKDYLDMARAALEAVEAAREASR